MTSMYGTRTGVAGIARADLRAWGPLAVMLALAGCTTGAEPPEVTTTAPKVSIEQTLAAAQEDIAARRYPLAYQRLSRLEPAARDLPEVRLIVGEVYLGVGSPKDALTQFESLQAEDAYRARAHQGMGLSLVALNDFNMAKQPLDLALGEDPSLWRSWMALGRVHDSNQDWQASEAAYVKALALQPDSPVVLNNIGMSLLLQHRYQEAAQEFQRALASDPGMEMLRANLRIALAWQGKYEEAVVGLHGAGRADDLNNVGYVAMLRGDQDAAQRFFAQALEASPTYHEDAARNLETLRLWAKASASQPAAPTRAPEAIN